MKCPTCGADIEEGAVICYNCGADCRMVYSQEENPEGVFFEEEITERKKDSAREIATIFGLVLAIIIVVAVAGVAIVLLKSGQSDDGEYQAAIYEDENETEEQDAWDENDESADTETSDVSDDTANYPAGDGDTAGSLDNVESDGSNSSVTEATDTGEDAAETTEGENAAVEAADGENTEDAGTSAGGGQTTETTILTDESEETTTSSGNSTENETSASSGQEAWKEAYIAYIEEVEAGETHSYFLFYLDKNDIPELYIQGNYEAEGDRICTIGSDGSVNVCTLNRVGGAAYIPGSGLLSNFNGNMGYYILAFYELTNGVFTYNRDSGGRMEQLTWENDEWVTEYFWNNESVTEDQFYANWDGVMMRAASVSLGGTTYGSEEIIEQILEN